MKRHWFIRLEWKPQDFWVGVFWKRGPLWPKLPPFEGRSTFDVWVCILPMLPIHFGYTTSIPHN